MYKKGSMRGEDNRTQEERQGRKDQNNRATKEMLEKARAKYLKSSNTEC